MSTSLRFLVAIVASVGVPAFGTVVEYAVDSSLSTLTLSGTFQNVPLTAQTPGSLTARYQGVFQGDINGGLLEFGRVIHSLPQSTAQLPIRDGSSATGEAAFGFRAGDALFAIQSLSLHLSTEYNQPIDIAAGTFYPSDVGFFIDGGTLYHSSAALPFGAQDLHGHGGGNRSTQTGTLSTMGNIETLTIPILTTFSKDLHAPEDLILTFSGKIVATRVVPEATASLLLLFGLGVFAGSRRCGRAPVCG